MTGFESQTSGIRSDSCTYWATTKTTALKIFLAAIRIHGTLHDDASVGISIDLKIMWFDDGPWWWSSGQRARLLFCQSEFESWWSLQFFCNIFSKRTKISKNKQNNSNNNLIVKTCNLRLPHEQSSCGRLWALRILQL